MTEMNMDYGLLQNGNKNCLCTKCSEVKGDDGEHWHGENVDALIECTKAADEAPPAKDMANAILSMSRRLDVISDWWWGLHLAMKELKRRIESSPDDMEDALALIEKALLNNGGL